MIDLHMHSNFSLDGELTPKELIDLCIEKKLKLVSITDHNDCYAFLEVKDYAKAQGITLIPGIEIDCIYKDTPLHLLAYGIPPETKALQTLCHKQLELETNASSNRISAINALGFDLRLEDFNHLEGSVITPEDIAEVLLYHKDFPRHPLLLPYRTDGMRSDNPLVNFYWDYFSKGKPCYQALDYPSLEAIIELIHDNKGVAVLAHPGITFRGEFDMIHDILALKIDGLEVFSSYHSANEVTALYEMAQNNSVFMTAGSDFHGKIKPTVKLGGVDYHSYTIDMLSQLAPLLQR